MRKNYRLLITTVLVLSLGLISGCSKSNEGQTQTTTLQETTAVAETETIAPETETEIETEEATTAAEEAKSVPIIITGKHYDYKWYKKAQGIIASYTSPMISLDESCSNDYPQLKNALDDLSAARKKSQKKEYKELVASAKRVYKEMGENFTEHKANEDIFLRRADNKYVSILIEGYTYSGGAHGTPYNIGKTYDANTGKELKLSDVIKDKKKFTDLVQKQLDEFWNDITYYDDLDLPKYIDENFDELAWVMDYEGLTVIFNPYAIAPYSSGTQVVTITFKDNSDIFKEDYESASEGYGMQLSYEKPYYYDINNDGKQDEIIVSGIKEDEDHYTSQSITVNGKSYSDKAYGYSVEPMFIHMKDGKNYIYIENSTENALENLSVYYFKGTKVKKGQHLGFGMHQIYEEEATYYNKKYVLTNPDDFMLDTRTDLLSTSDGYAHFSVGEKGTPIADTEWFVLSDEIPLKVKKPVKATIVDEKTGEKKGETELKKGDKVTYFRTDNASYGDLKLKDGSVVRVKVKTGDWPRTINGVNIEKIFKGTVFAG